jgi:hypothetical protein
VRRGGLGRTRITLAAESCRRSSLTVAPIQVQQRAGARACTFLFPFVLSILVYGRPETDPSITPVSVKSAGALAALRNTAVNVAV